MRTEYIIRQIFSLSLAFWYALRNKYKNSVAEGYCNAIIELIKNV